MPRDDHPVYNRLEVLRVERGLSRRQLADQLDVNHQTIGYIERGDYNPSLQLALRIAELFRLPVQAIFGLRPMAAMSETMSANSTKDEADTRRGSKNCAPVAPVPHHKSVTRPPNDTRGASADWLRPYWHRGRSGSGRVPGEARHDGQAVIDKRCTK